jgi:hypothetical protein
MEVPTRADRKRDRWIDRSRGPRPAREMDASLLVPPSRSFACDGSTPAGHSCGDQLGALHEHAVAVAVIVSKLRQESVDGSSSIHSIDRLARPRAKVARELQCELAPIHPLTGLPHAIAYPHCLHLSIHRSIHVRAPESKSRSQRNSTTKYVVLMAGLVSYFDYTQHYTNLILNTSFLLDRHTFRPQYLTRNAKTKSYFKTTYIKLLMKIKLSAAAVFFF